MTGIWLCEGKDCTFVGNIAHNPVLLQNTSNNGIVSQKNYEGCSIRQVLWVKKLNEKCIRCYMCIYFVNILLFFNTIPKHCDIFVLRCVSLKIQWLCMLGLCTDSHPQTSIANSQLIVEALTFEVLLQWPKQWSG